MDRDAGLKPQSSHRVVSYQQGARSQQGIAVISVVVFLLVLAAMLVLQGREQLGATHLATADGEVREVEYITQAGIQQAVWLAQNQACSGDLTIPLTPLGPHNYSATVDSAVTTTAYTMNVSRDSWINEAAPNDNFGGDSELVVKNNPGGNFRALYHFDLSSLPAGSIVQSATAWFYVIVKDDEEEIEIHAVTAPWTEGGVTWNNISTSFDSTRMGSIPPQEDNGIWVSISMNGAVQHWLNNPSLNHGIVLSATSNGQQSKYSSGENSANLQPYLEVVVSSSGVATPVQITATGTLTSGTTRTLSHTDVPVYQTSLNTFMRPDSDASDDAEIWAQSPNNNYGDATETWVSSATNDTTRSLLRFDMNAIPAGARILNATLALTRQSGTGSNQPVSAHRITASWSEASVTWNNRNLLESWGTAGADFDATAIATTPVGPSNGRYEWDITQLTQGWVDRSYPNHGVILVAGMPGMDGQRFYTSDQAQLVRHPALTVVFACECGRVCVAPHGGGTVMLLVGDFSRANAKRFVARVADSILGLHG